MTLWWRIDHQVQDLSGLEILNRGMKAPANNLDLARHINLENQGAKRNLNSYVSPHLGVNVPISDNLDWKDFRRMSSP